MVTFEDENSVLMMANKHDDLLTRLPLFNTAFDHFSSHIWQNLIKIHKFCKQKIPARLFEQGFSIVCVECALAIDYGLQQNQSPLTIC